MAEQAAKVTGEAPLTEEELAKKTRREEGYAKLIENLSEGRDKFQLPEGVEELIEKVLADPEKVCHR